MELLKLLISEQSDSSNHSQKYSTRIASLPGVTLGMLKRAIDINYASLKRYGRKVLNVAELGIGLNPKAKVTGNILEDEKALNTAHIAFGNNKSFGDRVDCLVHLDFVFFKPNFLIDGVKVKI